MVLSPKYHSRSPHHGSRAKTAKDALHTPVLAKDAPLQGEDGELDRDDVARLGQSDGEEGKFFGRVLLSRGASLAYPSRQYRQHNVDLGLALEHIYTILYWPRVQKRMTDFDSLSQFKVTHKWAEYQPIVSPESTLLGRATPASKDDLGQIEENGDGLRCLLFLYQL
ncbi:hypothetical protein PG988_004785 [Apiospora saccharicola]